MGLLDCACLISSLLPERPFENPRNTYDGSVFFGHPLRVHLFIKYVCFVFLSNNVPEHFDSQVLCCSYWNIFTYLWTDSGKLKVQFIQVIYIVLLLLIKKN